MSSLSTTAITIQYFAQLREQAGLQSEELVTTAKTAGELLDILIRKYAFTVSPRSLCVAINEEYASMETGISDGDTIVFLPPVAGG